MTAVQACRHGRTLLEGCASCLGPDDWQVSSVPTICEEVGHHSWRSAGLDVRRDRLVSVKVCVWCNWERTSAPRPHPPRQ